MKYHVNQDGEIKRCTAAIQECPVGAFMGEHYSSKQEAMDAYSARVEKVLSAARSHERLLAESNQRLKTAETTYKNALAAQDEAALNLAFSELRAATLENGELTREKYLLNSEKSALNIEPFEETPQPWSPYPYKFDPKVYYPTRWGKMEFHHGLPEDLKGLLAKELAAFSDYSFSEAYEKIDSYGAYESEELANGRVPLERDAYIVSLFQKGAALQKKPRVFVDIETTGFDPRLGEIIEIGIVKIAPTGEVLEQYEGRFDLESESYRDVRGVGPTEIHKISPNDLVGKPKFSSPEVQAELGRLLNDPNVILGAHNDSFENKYLNLHLDEFWETHARITPTQKAQNAPTQDTMLLSTFLEHSTASNKLEDFSQGNGVPYENAHTALADAQMTAKAYVNFRNKLMAQPLGQRPTLA